MPILVNSNENLNNKLILCGEKLNRNENKVASMMKNNYQMY